MPYNPILCLVFKTGPSWAYDTYVYWLLGWFYFSSIILSLSSHNLSVINFLCVWTTAKNNHPKLFKKQLNSKFQYYSMYFKPSQIPRVEAKVSAMQSNISNMLCINFTHFSPDEESSLQQCYSNGMVFFIYGMNAKGTSIFLGAMLFSADKEGIWINWSVIANERYTNNFFGRRPQVNLLGDLDLVHSWF